MREMKNSGVEWIGLIPKNWNISKISEIYFERSMKVSDKKYKPLSVTKNGILPQLENVAKTNNNDNRKLVLKNDFVINSRSDRKGACGISDYDGSVSLINIVLRPYANICNNYFSYVFKSELFAEEFFRNGHGIVDDLWSTKWSNMKKINIPFPTIKEQQNIASFLDSRCAYLDAIVKEFSEQIIILQELRQSIICKAVTKGLNPDAEMKDSGVSWIGDIPKDWEVKRIRYLPNQEKDSFIDGDWIESPVITDSGIRYYTTGNIGDGKFKEQGDGYISEETFRMLKCKFAYPGDLVFSRLNAPYGRSCILPNIMDRCVLAVDIVILRTNENKKYVCYVTQCDGYQRSVEDNAAGTTMKRISRTNLGNIKIPVPPRDIQDCIVGYLDAECARIDAVISDKQEQIATLEEYRKSLIYNAVTGKMEVPAS